MNWEQYLSAQRERVSQTHSTTDDTERCDFRNAFESDFGRVIFSTATRRMHDKTQVFPLTNGDSVHTRLTHSLEVMSVAVSLGINLCRHPHFIALYGKEKAFDMERQIPVILKTTAFVHDIGNPPFGHYGEDIIQQYFRTGNGKTLMQTLSAEQQLDFTQFDGNAQGFRILTKMPYLNDLYGLNLTYATLGAYLKYPNTGAKNKQGDIGVHKHGVFTSEQTVLAHIATQCGLYRADGTIKRHPLAFLVEAADTICYRVMDLEDGITRRLLTAEEALRALAGDMQCCEKNVRHLVGLSDKDNTRYTAEKMVVDLRVGLMNYLIRAALKTYIGHLADIDAGTFGKELLEDDPLCKALGRLEVRAIFRTDEIARAELTGATVLTALLDQTIDLLVRKKDWRIMSLLSRSMVHLALAESGIQTADSQAVFTQLTEADLYTQLRLVVDWIAGMTDKYALDTYHFLCGK